MKMFGLLWFCLALVSCQKQSDGQGVAEPGSALSVAAVSNNFTLDKKIQKKLYRQNDAILGHLFLESLVEKRVFVSMQEVSDYYKKTTRSPTTAATPSIICRCLRFSSVGLLRKPRPDTCADKRPKAKTKIKLKKADTILYYLHKAQTSYPAGASVPRVLLLNIFLNESHLVYESNFLLFPFRMFVISEKGQNRRQRQKDPRLQNHPFGSKNCFFIESRSFSSFINSLDGENLSTTSPNIA